MWVRMRLLFFSPLALRSVGVVVLNASLNVIDRLVSEVQSLDAVSALISIRFLQLFRGCPLVVVLDGLQDPGNAGAIVRAAEAFGATGVLFLKGTASPYNSKTLRASAGSLFRIPYLHGVDAALARAALQQNRVELYAGVPQRPGGRPGGLLHSPTLILTRTAGDANT